MAELPMLPLLGVVDVPGWVIFLVVVAVFVVPFALGALLGRALRARDLSFKIGVVLFTLVLGITPFVWQGVLGMLERNQYATEHAEWASRQLTEEQRQALDAALEQLKQTNDRLRFER